VLVNFWATWCAPCRIEYTWLIEVQPAVRSQGPRDSRLFFLLWTMKGNKVVQPYVLNQRFDVNGQSGSLDYQILLGDTKGSPTNSVAFGHADQHGSIHVTERNQGDRRLESTTTIFPKTLEKSTLTRLGTRLTYSHLPNPIREASHDQLPKMPSWTVPRYSIAKPDRWMPQQSYCFTVSRRRQHMVRSHSGVGGPLSCGRAGTGPASVVRMYPTAKKFHYTFEQLARA